jgi:LPS O-antigen subunit length determinant protein (WzzB/FepE family)
LYNDEIDLLAVVVTILDNKLKIFLIAALFAITMFGYQINKKAVEPKYMTTTEIRPISFFDEFEYKTYNLYIEAFNENNLTYFRNSAVIGDTYKVENILDQEDTQVGSNEIVEQMSYRNIERSYLLNLFIEKLNDNTLFKSSIRTFNLLKKEDYESEQEYKLAITKLVSSITLLPPNNEIKKGPIEKYWRIKYMASDVEQWQNFLNYIQQPANEEIRFYINKSFKQFFLNEKKLKDFAIEDVNMKIKDALENYDIEIARKILYLREQGEIARELDYANNNLLESSSIKTDSAVVTTLVSEIPYYMRGFEMIEKEIELIEKRKDKKAFTPNLGQLEQRLRELKSNKTLERLESLFEETPIVQSNIFYAAKIMTQTTSAKKLNDGNDNLLKMVIIAGLLGALIGIIYISIGNAVQSRK